MATRDWHTLRIELAMAPGFPAGSAARAFMLRLPLDAEGRFDSAAFARRPKLATFRRFWPSERDLRGTITWDGGRFALVPEDMEAGPCCHLEIDGRLAIGAQATLCLGDGTRLPFHVTAIQRQGSL